MQKKILFVFFSSLIFMMTSAQAQTHYCPKTHNYISVGSNILQVKALCGAPTSEKEEERLISNKVPSEQWFYTFRSHSLQDTELKASLSFVNGKLTVIEVNGKGVSNLTLCRGGSAIGVGDTTSRVEMTCGRPAFVNKSLEGGRGDVRLVTIWEYDAGFNMQKTIMTFENGILRNIQTR